MIVLGLSRKATLIMAAQKREVIKAEPQKCHHPPPSKSCMACAGCVVSSDCFKLANIDYQVRHVGVQGTQKVGHRATETVQEKIECNMFLDFPIKTV